MSSPTRARGDAGCSPITPAQIGCLILRRRMAALFVVLALAGCAPGTTGQAGAPDWPSHLSARIGTCPSTAEGTAAAVAAVCSWRTVRNGGDAPQSGKQPAPLVIPPNPRPWAGPAH
jgi:hypothetical protein